MVHPHGLNPPMTKRDKPVLGEVEEIVSSVVSADKKSVSRIFNLLEDRRIEKTNTATAALDELYRGSLDRSHVIGVTGPPGAGKSSLVSRMIQSLRRAGKTVGVIAVDPSSKVSRGAILGDRIRLEYDAGDAGVFVRSMANRGDYGGVSDRTYAGTIALRAAFDVVLVETVGVGQSESEIADLTDTMALVIQPASGDLLQFLKAGIMEQPHLFVVNKSDLGEPARKALLEVKSALGGIAEEGQTWEPRALAVSALTVSSLAGSGLDEMLKSADAHRAWLAEKNFLRPQRERQAAGWIWQSLLGLYGRRGAARWGDAEKIARQLHAEKKIGPFQTLRRLMEEVER